MGRMRGQVLFAVLFLAGGVGHFVATDTYTRIMPSYLPAHRELVLISGVAEFLLGAMLLVSRSRRLAAWGLIALLIAVFPANVFMWQHADRFGLPAWALLGRLPLQGLLIAWAWLYTRPQTTITKPVVATDWTSQMMIALSLIAILDFNGCGLGGSSLDRLKGGPLARTKGATDKPVIVYFAASEETIPPGTVVKVVADKDLSEGDVDRKVVVGFSEGPHQGLAALIRRSDLEPDR